LLDAEVIRWQFAERPNPKLLDELHEVRGIVEPAAARLAAERATDDDLTSLEAALTAMLEAHKATTGNTAAAAVTADLWFHRALLHATHNELLQRMEVVIETGLAERDRLVHGLEPHNDPVPSHRAIVDAIRARDATGAETAMQELLAKAARDVATAASKARRRPQRRGR
jgi:DNA-binding FadR family transcriptional regulator